MSTPLWDQREAQRRAELKTARMRVVVRVRPPGRDEGCHIDVEEHVGGRIAVNLPEPAHHPFSVVLGPKCTQHEVYLSCGVPMIEAGMEGRDALLFAYGQSGAGKTFSMYGAEGGKNPSKLDGVVPATVSELFRRTTAIEKDNMGQVHFSLSCSLVEIQGSQIFDLLADADKDTGRQPACMLAGSQLVGNRVERIFSSRSLTHTIERGMQTRTTAPNIAHENSSRSHCLLQLILERTDKINTVGKASGQTERKLSAERPTGAKTDRPGGRESKDSIGGTNGGANAPTVTRNNFYMLDLAGSEAFSYDAGLSGQVRAIDDRDGTLVVRTTSAPLHATLMDDLYGLLA